jgi:CCR4-NOT transcription complex subunit 6
LEVLDQFQLNPPELGMLTQLKEPYRFDNRVATLPPEIGGLPQLQTLGIELDAALQKDGTPTLMPSENPGF